MANPGDAFPPGEDWVPRQLRDLQRQITAIDSKRLDSLGAGGVISVYGSIIVEPGGHITLSSGTFSASMVDASTSMSTGTLSATGTVSAGGDIDATGNANISGDLNLTGPGYFPQAYNNPVTTGTYYSAYLNGGDSRLGRTASSRRYKQDISTMPVSEQAVLALRIVQFRWKAEVEAGRDQGFDFGVVAEELHDLGLTPWVFYNEAGEPEGVHYERMFLMALPLLQHHEERIAAIEKRLAGVERKLSKPGAEVTI